VHTNQFARAVDGVADIFTLVKVTGAILCLQELVDIRERSLSEYCSPQQSEYTMLDAVLIPECELLRHESVVIAKAASIAPGLSFDVEDRHYGADFVRYLLLTHWPRLVGVEFRGDNQLVYNRYYWFCRFVRAYERMNGQDAGLQQQAFQILEHCSEPVDWELVSEIESRVKEEAS
jgi:hypothetical protein